ncbi:hypothetical protein BVRB_6g131290 [Beta vulgaris subsp. vulgaris]|nr:hypothetical protein BVRB_6g131290 [Beta vulgaris subsp. vulgaris]
MQKRICVAFLRTESMVGGHDKINLMSILIAYLVLDWRSEECCTYSFHQLKSILLVIAKTIYCKPRPGSSCIEWVLDFLPCS